jgi:hypothetical protein
LKGEPWCSNWKEVAENGATPINIDRRFLKGGSQVAKSMADKSSLAVRSEVDQVDLAAAINEEENKEIVKVSPSNIEAIQSSSLTFGNLATLSMQ